MLKSAETRSLDDRAVNAVARKRSNFLYVDIDAATEVLPF